MRMSVRGIQMAASARIRRLPLARSADQPMCDAIRHPPDLETQGATARADDKLKSTVEDPRGISEDASPDPTLGLLRWGSRSAKAARLVL
jgi:hypothetical protein